MNLSDIIAQSFADGSRSGWWRGLILGFSVGMGAATAIAIIVAVASR